jgi:hypothetical protein
MTSIAWAKATTGTWTTAGNWSGGVVPGPNDQVVIDAHPVSGNTYSVLIESAVSVNSLVLNAYATLQLGGPQEGSQIPYGTLSAKHLYFKYGTLDMCHSTLSGTVTAGGFNTFIFDYGDYNSSGATLLNVIWQGLFDPRLAPLAGSQFLNIVGQFALESSNGSGPGTAFLQGSSLDFHGNETLNNATISFGSEDISDSPTSEILSSASEKAAANLVLGPTLILDADGRAILQSDGTITNDGTIIVGPDKYGADRGPLTIQGKGVFLNAGVINDNGLLTEQVSSFVNTGTINVSAGNTLTLTQSATQTWTNSGTINIMGGSVFFAGTLSTAQLGSFETSYGGRLGLLGTLSNSGTLVLGTGGLPKLTLDRGGVIDGGTVQGGGLIEFDGGALRGVTWQGGLSLTGADESVVIQNGIKFLPTSGGTTTITIGSSLEYSVDSVTFANSQTLNNTSIQLGNAASPYGAEAQLAIGTAATLTLGTTTSVHLQRAGIGGGNLVNDGVIYGPASGGATLDLSNFVNGGLLAFNTQAVNAPLEFVTTIQASNFSNTGTIEIGGGIEVEFKNISSDSIVSEAWSSTGTVVVSHGTLLLDGTLTTASLETAQTGAGAEIILAGTLQNSGQTLAVGGSSHLGTLTLEGSITGGTLNAADDGLSFLGGTLNGVTSTSGLYLNGPQADVTIENGLILAGRAPQTISIGGSSSQLGFLGSDVLSNAVVDLGSSAGPATLSLLATSVSATLDVTSSSRIVQTGSNFTLDGGTQTSLGGVLLNHGTITAALAGGSLTVSNLKLENIGVLDVGNDDTVVTSSGTFVNTGVLSITGSTTNLSFGSDIWATTFSNRGTVKIAGGVLNLGDSELGARNGAPVSNTGTIEVDGGVLSLNEDASTAALGAITVSQGGSFVIDQATLNNAGAVLALGTGTALGKVTLYGGNISGGTIVDNGDGLGYLGYGGGT